MQTPVKIIGNGDNIRTALITIGNAHNHNVDSMVFAFEDGATDEVKWSDLPLKTIVFVTPKGVTLAARSLVDGAISLDSQILDGAGVLQYTVYAGIEGSPKLKNSGLRTCQVGAALSNVGGIEPVEVENVITDCVAAKEAAEAATQAANDAAGSAAETEASIVAAEALRVSSDILRGQTVEAIEANYAPRLTGVEAGLAESHNQINDLETTKLDKNTTDIAVSQINKNLGKFDQTYMTDLFLQQMAGTTPVNAVPAYKSITPDKVAFILNGKNIFNKVKITSDFSVSVSNGTLVAGSTFVTSDYIVIQPNTSYIKSGGHSYALYDINKAYISGNSSATFTTPSNAVYVRISVTKAILDTYQLEIGTVATTYENFYEIIPLKYQEKRPIISSDIPPLPVNVFDFAKLGTNIFDKSQCVADSYINGSTGALEVGVGFTASGFVPVLALTNYTIKTLRHIAYYNVNKVYISGISGSPISNYQALTPANTAYIRFSWYSPEGTVDTQQVNIGVNLLAYEPYGYKLAKEYLENTSLDDFLLFLPSEICVAVGRTIELYNSQVCWCGNINNYHFKWDCTVGKAMKRKFSVTGTTPSIGEYALTLTVYDNNMNAIATKSTTVKIVSSTISNAKTLLTLGDSLTNIKPWHGELRTLSADKYTMVGTMGNAPLKFEGRSGFSAGNYLTATAYTYGGQGVHPFWDGTRFNWNYYKTQTGISPDAVQIFLGTNDMAIDPTINACNIKQIVDYIRQDDASIPIFLVFTLYRGNQNGIGVQINADGFTATNKGVWKLQEDAKVYNLMVKLNTLLSAYTNLHFVPISLCFDSEFNFGAVSTPVNPRSTQSELLPTEATHPTDWFQMSDIMFSVMAKYLNS